MKLSVVIAEGVRQIMMTPETKHEREALKWIAPNSTAHVACQWGTYDDKPSHYPYQTAKSQAGYLRRFAQTDSLMFVIEDGIESKDITNNK